MIKFIISMRKTAMYLPLALILLLWNTSCDSDDNGAVSGENGLSMKTQPKVKYVVGDKLDLSGMVVVMDQEGNMVDVPFDSFAAENITTDPANGKVLDFSDESVIVSLGNTGRGLTQPIDVTNDIVELQINTEPRTDYVNGERLDLSNLMVTTVQEDGTTNDVAFADFGTNFQAVPADSSLVSIDSTTINITYLETGAAIEQEITVTPFEPVSAEVVTPPTKAGYDVGEPLDLAGSVIKYSMADGNEIEIPFEDFENFGITSLPTNGNKLAVTSTEVQIVTASEFTVGVPVTVNQLDVTAMSLEMKPAQTLYNVGDSIALKDLTVRLAVTGKEDLIVASDDFEIYDITTDPAEETLFEEGTAEIVVSYPDLVETVSIPLGSEIIYESDFSSGVDGWAANQNGGGSVNVYVEDGVLIANEIVPGTNTYDIQLFKPNITLVQDGSYKLTVVVKAVPEQGGFSLSLSVGDGDGRDGYQPYDGGGKIPLTDTEYATYEKEFVMGSADTPAARILLDIGNQTNGIMVQSVKLEKL